MAQQRNTERHEPTFGENRNHKARAADAGEINDVSSLRYRVVKTVKVNGETLFELQYHRVLDATNPPPGWKVLMDGLTTMDSAIAQADTHYNNQVRFTQTFLLERAKV